MQNSIHFVLQGKGGVGKSLIASMIAQYCQKNGHTPACADVDPTTPTLSKTKALNAQLMEITRNGQIVQSLFDPMIVGMLKTNSPCVIDTGTSSFAPMIKYIKDNDTFDLLTQSGKNVYVHAVIMAGQELQNCFDGFIAMLDMVKGTGAKIVLWSNEMKGVPLIDGKLLNDVPEAKGPDVAGVVTIIDRDNEAFLSDMKKMSEGFRTLDEVMNDETVFIPARLRIEKIFKGVFDQLDQVFPDAAPVAKKGKAA